jgi:hypothetical protein
MATAPKAQGIMDLPENEDMNQAPQLSPMESYDAVTTASAKPALTLPLSTSRR